MDGAEHMSRYTVDGTCRELDRQADRQTDRQTDRQSMTRISTQYTYKQATGNVTKKPAFSHNFSSKLPVKVAVSFCSCLDMLHHYTTTETVTGIDMRV